MKRRVLAVLPVAMFVVLAGTGEATSATGEIGVTKGRPWTGPPGVRVSVAELTARQRAQDRRIGARPRGVREKPEPPEEAGAPAEEEASEESASKLSGPAVPQLPQRAAGEAVGPSSSLLAGTSFLGAQVSESGFIPPDSMGSVSPTQILVDVNGRIKIFDKSGNLGGLNVADDVFWSPVGNGFEPTDPQVEYDRLSGRWIISAVNVENSNNRVMVAVSNSSTITDSSSFTFYFFNHNDPPPAGDAGQFADYPQMGVDKNAVYIGVNDFGGTFSTSAFVIRKSSILSGGPIVVTAFRDLALGSGPGPFSPQPATDMDPSVNEGYIVGNDNQSFSQLDIRRISDPGGTPTISGNLTLAVPSTYFPLNVPQGTHGSLDALDDRLFEAMIARKPNGALSLWTAHNIAVNTSGVGGSAGSRDGARWYELGTLSTTPTLVQSGTLFDSAASNPRFFFIPSIAANGQGHASLNSTTAGSGRFAEIASSGHLASDPTGLTEPFDITQTSTSSYTLGQGNPKRWGDYSQTVVDPTDNQTFWTFQEYANATDSWGVRVIKLKAPPPATPTTASPNPISGGQSSVSVQITGTSSGGSGFFDPGADSGGPGFPNHISGSVSGGVTVNSVTFTDPTHVTLSLNTSSAPDGAKDVTITNPDGQSSTASNLLNVGADSTPPAPPTLSTSSPTSPANNNSPKILGGAEAGSTVRLYTDAACTVGPVASGSAATFASPGITASVANNSTTTFYATATDASNNTSGCSSSFVTYVEDSIAPAEPTALATSPATSPASPSNDSSPEVSGSADSGSTVKVYKAPTTSDCTAGNLGVTGTAAAFASPGLTVSVPLNATTTLRATATDAALNTSPCSSASVNYVEDSNPPAAPSSLAVSPASPANNNSPRVSGSAEAGSTVNLYTTSGCTGSPVATGTAAAFASPGLTASVSDDTTTTFKATATDAAGNVSPCSTGVNYVEDSTPPAAPSSLTSSPTSPANDNSPEIRGSAEASSTVKVYKAPTTFDCLVGNLAQTGTAAAFSSPGLTVSVTDNTTTTFRATATDVAGNVSSCSSSSVAYQEDSTILMAPTFSGTSPSSPANDNVPKILGSAPAGSTVSLYTTSNCTGSPVATDSAVSFASPGIPVSVGDNTATTFHATATNVSTSACSPGSITYLEDSTPPTASVDSGPSGVTNDHTPTFTFSSEPLAVFQCSIDTGTASFGACSGPGNSHTAPAALPDGNYTFRVRATDQAANTGAAATRAFTVSTPASPALSPPDLSPPETTITKGPRKTRKRRPGFGFAAGEPGSRFQCQFDSKPFQPCASPTKPQAKLKFGRHFFRVEAIDPAGNVDGSPAVRKFKVLPPS
jgi:hypothetical protein